MGGEGKRGRKLVRKEILRNRRAKKPMAEIKMQDEGGKVKVMRNIILRGCSQLDPNNQQIY